MLPCVYACLWLPAIQTRFFGRRHACGVVAAAPGAVPLGMAGDPLVEHVPPPREFAGIPGVEDAWFQRSIWDAEVGDRQDLPAGLLCLGEMAHVSLGYLPIPPGLTPEQWCHSVEAALAPIFGAAFTRSLVRTSCPSGAFFSCDYVPCTAVRWEQRWCLAR